MRKYQLLDRLIETADQVLKTVVKPTLVTREQPGQEFTDESLSETEKQYSARLMRINHAGEIAAQGLYHGQAFTARDNATAEHMRKNAHEESDHLAWCKQRLNQLDARTSIFTPLWYVGSFTIGTIAGLAGNRYSFGFVKETEEQVVEHLDSHLAKAPVHDKATLAIIEQIKQDEGEHARAAAQVGACELPKPIKSLMRMSAKIMTTTAYYL